MTEHEGLAVLIYRAIGTLIGVLASLIFVAPEPTRNVGYRILTSLAMGFIFAPVVSHLPGLGFLGGDGHDLALARGAATGFVIWSVLEFIARMLSSTEWLERLVKEVLRLKTGGEQ